MSRRFSISPSLVAVALLLIFLWLQFSTLAVTAPTFDEPMHITRGYAFIARGADYVPKFCSPCSPVLGTSLSGLTLLLQPNLQMPAADDPIWLAGGDTGLIESFMWANQASPQIIVFLARLPVMGVSLLLGTLIYRWAKRRSGAWSAIGALTLYVFCPNMLAHSRLATTDVVSAATYALSAYAFTLALDQPRNIYWLFSGVTLGLALAAKISAVWLMATFGLLIAIEAWRNRRQGRAALRPFALLFVTLVLGGITLWGIYRFSIGSVVPNGLPLPAPTYWREWLDFNVYLREPTPGYLFEQVSTHGWWYYFPIVFVVKTPLPELLMVVLAGFVVLRQRGFYRAAKLWLAPLLLFASLLLSPHDLGYRYLLPILPFVFVASADVFAQLSRRRWLIVAGCGLLAWQIGGTLTIYPYYLTYFNDLVGGPERGRFILSDSNLDWGQDLIGLKQYVDQHQIDHLKFSYFGATDPAAYGLHTEALPPVALAMHQQSAWWLHTYHPANPPPGKYAISVTSLMGGIWTDRSTYAYFRTLQPEAIIGHSIYLYTVPARGSSVALSLAGLQLDQIDAATYQQFGTNDVRPRWFDATRSIIAASDQSWLAIADDQPLDSALTPLLADLQPVTRTVTADDQRAYALYHADIGAQLLLAAQQAQQRADEIDLPVRFGESADLIGFEIKRTADQINVITYWRAGDHVQAPLQLFVHALGADGSIEAQEDRLDVPAYGWHSGDLFAQVNHLALPDPTSTVLIAIGFYDPNSGVRLTVSANGQGIGEQLLLAKAVTP